VLGIQFNTWYHRFPNTLSHVYLIFHDITWMTHLNEKIFVSWNTYEQDWIRKDRTKQRTPIPFHISKPLGKSSGTNLSLPCSSSVTHRWTGAVRKRSPVLRISECYTVIRFRKIICYANFLSLAIPHNNIIFYKNWLNAIDCFEPALMYLVHEWNRVEQGSVRIYTRSAYRTLQTYLLLYLLRLKSNLVR
jgi:hypothetical protein